MYSHVLVGSNDIARSKKFYDALFAAIGGQPGAEMRPGRIAYTHNGARFVVTVPNDGKPATAADGAAIGRRRWLAVVGYGHDEAGAVVRIGNPARPHLGAGLSADRGEERVVEFLRPGDVVAADHDMAVH